MLENKCEKERDIKISTPIFHKNEFRRRYFQFVQIIEEHYTKFLTKLQVISFTIHHSIHTCEFQFECTIKI